MGIIKSDIDIKHLLKMLINVNMQKFLIQERHTQKTSFTQKQGITLHFDS